MDQFKGRCGRQGDPGETFTVLSIEDDLIRNFGKLAEKVGGKLEDVIQTVGGCLLKKIHAAQY